MLILASGSPRRQALLQMITEDFTVRIADVSEDLPPDIPPQKAVEVLAARKAQAVFARYPADIIIGADTIVALGSQILGKPRDAKDAAEMLRMLSGKTHTVYTGVNIVAAKKSVVFSQRTQVAFLPLREDEILRYSATPEPLDKAGAYGIQGKAALFIDGISGDYYNVMGLPVAKLARELEAFL